MIYGKPLINPETGKLYSLELHMNREGAEDFSKLLSRALNTAAPELHEDWIQLADKLDDALRQQK